MIRRPTRDQLAKATYELEALAYEDAELFYLLAQALNLAEWLRAEHHHHKNQAGYKRNSEVAPPGTGGHSSVEAQFADHSTPTVMYRTDEMVRDTQKTRRRWISQWNKLVYDQENDAREIGYPHRSVEEQWRAG